MSPVLEQGLIILVFTTIVVLVVLTVFAVRLFIRAARLAKNLDKTTSILNTELEPTIKELNHVLMTVNKLADSADTQMNSAKAAIAKTLGVAGMAFGGLKSFSGSFFKGFASAIKLFMKKR